MPDTPKCISSSRIVINHDKSIDFDHFTGKNDHYKSVKIQRKRLILTDPQCRSLILKHSKYTFYRNYKEHRTREIPKVLYFQRKYAGNGIHVSH